MYHKIDKRSFAKSIGKDAESLPCSVWCVNEVQKLTFCLSVTNMTEWCVMKRQCQWSVSEWSVSEWSVSEWSVSEWSVGEWSVSEWNVSINCQSEWSVSVNEMSMKCHESFQKMPKETCKYLKCAFNYIALVFLTMTTAKN